VAPRGVRGFRGGHVKLVVFPAVETRGRGVDGAAGLAEDVRRIVATGCDAA
jgi:hypothetical protein